MESKEFIEIREHAKLSQIALAEMLGVTDRQVRNYETSVTPIPPLVEKFMVELREKTAWE